MRWGRILPLVHRAVPADTLDEASLAACLRLAALRPDVVAQFKRVLNAIGLDRFDHAIDEESAAMRRLAANPPER